MPYRGGRIGPKPHRLAWTVVGVAVAVAVVLVVLVETGFLFAPTKGTITVAGVEWHIEQGTTTDGTGWFGPSYVNTTPADGYPQSVGSGGTFQAVLTISNLDAANHTVYSVTVASPCSVVSATPELPTVVPGRADDWRLVVTIQLPSTSSDETLSALVTVDALSGG